MIWDYNPMFIDKYSRKINYLRISVTDKCNLRCIYCMPEDGVPLLNHNDILRIEEILRIVKIFVKNGVNKIRITGGEPLVRKGILNLISGIREIMPTGDLSITTNGTLLNIYGKKLFEHGLDRVNISIDSLNRKTYKEITRRDMLPQVLEGLELISKLPYKKIKINMVPIKNTNEKEIIDFINLSKENDYQIRFIEFMPFNGETNWKDKYLIPSEIILKTIKEHFSIEEIEQSDTAKLYKIKNFQGTFGLISPMTEHFCERCNRMRLTANGLLRPCLFSEKMISIKEALRTSLTDTELEQIIFDAIKLKPISNPILDEDGKKTDLPMNYLGG